MANVDWPKGEPSSRRWLSSCMTMAVDENASTAPKMREASTPLPKRQAAKPMTAVVKPTCRPPMPNTKRRMAHRRLTDISKKTDGNRETRKAIDRQHTHMAPKQSQTIKVADLIANTKDICQADESFAVVYMREKRLLLEGMDADKKLMDYAWKLITDWEESQNVKRAT